MGFLDSPALVGASGNPARSVGVQFSGRAGPFLGLLVKGALLQLVTFGFYRFWLNTDLRRHLWSSTAVDGDALEYTGRGRELLIGFLFALAIIGPVFFIYFLVGIEAERAKAFLSLPLYLFLYFFGQFAIYRARRYRLTRTIWRGVRFWMQGSGLAYAWRSFLWALLVGVTLGLALPWREAALERYKMKHTYYGDLQGSFVGQGWDFFKRGVWIWLVAIILPVAFVLIGWAGFLNKNGLFQQNAAIQDLARQDLGMGLKIVIGLAIVAIYVLISLIPVALYAKYKAIEMKWWVSGVRFGDLSLNSRLRGRSMLWLYLKMAFFVWLTLVLFLLIFGILGWGGAIALHLDIMDLNSPAMKAQLQQLVTAHQVLLGIGFALSYIVMLLALGVVQRFFLMRGYWRLVAATLSISHIEAAEAIVAKGSAVSGFGEGLADGLDVAGF